MFSDLLYCATFMSFMFSSGGSYWMHIFLHKVYWIDDPYCGSSVVCGVAVVAQSVGTWLRNLRVAG